MNSGSSTLTAGGIRLNNFTTENSGSSTLIAGNRPSNNSTEEASQLNNVTAEPTKDSSRKFEIRACNTFLALKGILMVAAIILISSTIEISKAKPCDLEKVLDSLSVDNTSPCKYYAIKERSTDICDWGISCIVLNSIIFLSVFNYMWIAENNKTYKNITLAGIIIVGILAVFIYLCVMIYFYIEVLEYQKTQTDTNYAQIKSSMIAQLRKSYTSDNVTSGDAKSDSWNKFFIEYECCAVNQVQGTTNDFDSTPWCTTSGSCQATASQIPKTCCNYVTEDDYGSAPTTCHSSVSPGTFKSNCMIPIKTLSVVNIEECQVSLLLTTLLIIGTLEIAEFIIVLNVILLFHSKGIHCRFFGFKK